jgi:hypothetical protein
LSRQLRFAEFLMLSPPGAALEGIGSPLQESVGEGMLDSLRDNHLPVMEDG